MNQAATILLLLAVTAQSACIGGARQQTPMTLADLPATRIAATGPARAAAVEPALQVDRAEAIAAYRAYLEVSATDESLYAPALQRLADLLQADLDQRDALAVGDTQVSAPTEAEREAVADLYRQLLRLYPDRAENAAAWYQLARTEEGMGNLEGALLALAQLAADYPQTPRLDEVHFRRGEYHFALRDFAAAAAAYALVIDAGAGSDFYEQALYKRGWSLFRLQQYDVAPDMFVAVIDRHAIDGDASLDAVAPDLRQRIGDTLEVMALNFSYQNGAASIGEYFQRSGRRPWEALVYERLGEQYLEQQRYTDAAASFAAFAERSPLARRAPYLVLRSIEALGRGGFERQRRDAGRALLRAYGLDQPYWQAHPRTAEAELVGAIRAELDLLASYHHARAQAVKSRPRARVDVDVAAAIDWYGKRIAWFAAEADTAAPAFLLAELLFENGRYVEAVAAYESAAYDYPPHARSAEAGYAALLAYERAGANLAEAQRGAWQQAEIASSLRFAGQFELDARAAEVMLRAARKLFDGGDAAGARRVAAEVLQRFPQSGVEVRYGAHLVLGQQAFDADNYALAEAGFAQALAALPATDRRRAELTERLAASIYRQGEQQRTAGQLTLAAGHFLRVGQVAPDSPVRLNADFDAAAVLLQDRQWDSAIAVLEAFRQRYPRHRLQSQVTRELAVAYLETDQWLPAALEFERIAAFKGDPQLRREARWQTAELFDKAGERRRAIDAWASYVRNHATPVERAMEARLRLLEIFRAANDVTSVRRWQRALIAADARAGAERSDRTRFLAASAQLQLAEAELDAFREVRLVEPIRRNIERKRDLMQRSLTALGKAADYQIATVTTAATYYTAEVYHAFGRDLLASERPRDLDADALEEYELLLEEQAYPFEEKAITAHGINAARTSEGLYDDWVRRSFEQLAQLVPARYAKEERSVGVMAQLD